MWTTPDPSAAAQCFLRHRTRAPTIITRRHILKIGSLWMPMREDLFEIKFSLSLFDTKVFEQLVDPVFVYARTLAQVPKLLFVDLPITIEVQILESIVEPNQRLQAAGPLLVESPKFSNILQHCNRLRLRFIACRIILHSDELFWRKRPEVQNREDKHQHGNEKAVPKGLLIVIRIEELHCEFATGINPHREKDRDFEEEELQMWLHLVIPLFHAIVCLQSLVQHENLVHCHSS
mmetsp:Transcript_42490/g.74531  ORF Transcript_42490/g.74531 Transcript_42490/m.74531 type:complete len:234 (+) Transcript_42490:124-825(+)